MKVNQTYDFVNKATEQATGQTGLVQEDLSNIVEVGKIILNASDTKDKFLNALVNRIGREIFVDRKYTGFAPTLIRDAWEFGSIKMKVSGRLKEATENESWLLNDGTSYDPNIFYGSDVVVRFWNTKTTFEIPMSIGEEQLKQSFLSAEAMGRFISMLFNDIETSMTIKNDEVILRTINNMIGETIYADYQGGTLSASTGVKAINLLYEYNAVHTGATLTASNCLESKEFLAFASARMEIAKARLSRASKLFNIGGEVRFTPEDRLHVVMLDVFKAKSDTYLGASTFHKELVALPQAYVTPYWQGSGTDYAFGSASKIYITTTEGHSVTADGILAVMFDRDACGIDNENKRVTTNYNGKAEFTNYWSKMDSQQWNDFNENFVVFFIA